MKKLNKKVTRVSDSIQALGCICPCGCAVLNMDYAALWNMSGAIKSY